MRIDADYARCEGHGLCEGQAPEVFSLDDEGYLHHHFEGRDLPPELEGAGEQAADVCPVAALTVRTGPA